MVDYVLVQKHPKLTLPKSGAWIEFNVIGHTASDNVKDAVIEVHKGTAGGALKGARSLSVWDLTDAGITATPGGYYGLIDPTGFAPHGGPAIQVKASVTLKPSGIDVSAPQLKDLRLAIQQNVQAGLTYTSVYMSPYITSWLFAANNPNFYAAVAGQSYEIPKRVSIHMPATTATVNDSAFNDEAVTPFINNKTTIAGNEAPSPLVSNGVTSNTVADNPQIPAGFPTLTYIDPVSQKDLCVVVYSSMYSASYSGSFNDWAAVVPVMSGFPMLDKVEFLAKTSWALNVSSSLENPRQDMAVGGASTPAVTGGAYGANANDLPSTYDFVTDAGFIVSTAPTE